MPKIFKHTLILAPLLTYGFWGIHWLAPQHELAHQEGQIVFLAMLSAICSIPSLIVHWVFPPHPKFVLIAKRKYCIRLHIVAGSIEYLAGVVAFVLGHTPANKLVDDQVPFLAAGVMACVAVVLHVPTAALQAPIVFGSRLLMLPSYIFCIALHTYCASRLFLEPDSMFWLLQTFLAFSTYAWVRLFYYAFKRWRFFQGWSYSAAVLFAGSLIGPAVLGPLALVFLISFVACHVLLYWLVASPTAEQLFEDIWEHRRGSYASERLRKIWLRLRQLAIDRAARDVASDDEKRVLFEMLDTGGNGVLDATEVGKWLRREGATLVMARQMVAYLRGRQIDFDVFERYIWNLFERRIRDAGMLGRLKPQSRLQGQLDEESQAKLVFDQLDLDRSGQISTFELWLLLTEWDLPEEDVEKCVREFGNEQNEIDFSVFYTQMRPIWRFAFCDVIARPFRNA